MHAKPAPLLIASAVFEAGIGLALLLAPSIPVSLLLGAELTTPAAVTVARVAGGALLALAVACWIARKDVAARAEVMAMLLYNLVTTIVLVHASLVVGLHAIGLWPVIVLHAAMAIWCVAAQPTWVKPRGRTRE